MICFSSKREFSTSKFILNVQPLIFKQIDHQIGILLRNPPLIGSNRKIRNKTPYNKYVYQVRKKSLQSFGFAAELDRQICPIFLLSTLKLFFSKQQTPATEKMIVQYFTTVCQQSFSFAVPPKSLHFERKAASSFQPHFQHYNRPTSLSKVYFLFQKALSPQKQEAAALQQD